MARFAIGPQGGQALQSPTYKTYQHQKVFTETELTAGPVYINRVTGQQRIVCTFTDAGNTYTFSFSITGGTNRPTTNVLPMFPNTSKTYTHGINYGLDPLGLPPVGCTVEMLPIPTSKTVTRINIFDVTESVSGSDYVFRFSECPFLNIPMSIESVGPALPDNSTLAIDIRFFRVTPDLRTCGKLISSMTPTYNTKVFDTLIPAEGGSSPLDTPGTKVPFTRYAGQQTIIFTNVATEYFFAFDVDYGIIGQAGGYIGYTSSPTMNCSVVSPPIPRPSGVEIANITISGGNTNSLAKLIRLEVTSTVADGGGRTYTFEFSPFAYTAKQPTISLTSGAALGNTDVSVAVYARYFTYV